MTCHNKTYKNKIKLHKTTPYYVNHVFYVFLVMSLGLVSGRNRILFKG